MNVCHYYNLSIKLPSTVPISYKETAALKPYTKEKNLTDHQCKNNNISWLRFYQLRSRVRRNSNHIQKDSTMFT